jgi:tetratricopeptide (TPR) repeat protein
MFTAAADHFTKEGFFVKAIAIYKKIIRLDPTLIEVYETLADLYRRQGLVNEARSQYQVVADYYKQADNQEALVSVFEKMVELEPDNPSHRLKLAEFYCGSEQIPQAMEQYQKIAHFMLEHGKVEEAYKVYLGAFELKVDDLGFLTDIIVQLTDFGHDDVAQRLLSQAIARNPDCTRVADLVDISIPDGTEQPDEQVAEDLLEGVEAAGEDQYPDLRIDLAQGAAKIGATGVELPVDLAQETRESPVAADPPAEAQELEVVKLEDLGEAEPEEPAAPVAETHRELDPKDETGEFEIDLEDLERLSPIEEQMLTVPALEAAEPIEQEPADRSAGELVTEANVLSNYGLESKAVELLENALRLEPEHAEAAELLLHLHHQEGRSGKVVEVAQRFVDADGLPSRLRELLDDWNYRIEAGRVLPSDAVAETVEETVMEPETAQTLDTRLNWLEEESTVSEGAGTSALFGEEDEFFDLAAELEEELIAEETGDEGGELMPQLEEQSIEEIVEGFKQGVAETLSSEDYDTHYNLGIAYREMGLVDEAIGEFQLAAKSEQYLVDCCSLLGASFLEKGFPDLAVKWYERGLKAPKVSDEEKLGLLYELGNLYLATGERGTAKETFAEIYGANSNYRDVVAKLEELRQS